MDRLPKLFWLWIIIGMIVVSLVIGLIFVLINRCISKNAEQYNTNSHQEKNEYYAQGNSYHPKDIEEDLPPLPPRTQFDTCPGAQSYENLEELPDYVKVADEVLPPPYTQTARQETCYDNDSTSSEEYDDIGEAVAHAVQDDDEDYDDVG